MVSRGVVKASAVAASLLAIAATSSDAQPPQGQRPLSLEKLERISDYLNGQVAGGKIAGAVVLVQRHGKPVYLKSLGLQDVTTRTPMSPDTLFAVYSLSKLVTSVAAMMLVDEGKLALDDPLSKYIPAFADVKVGIDSKTAAGEPVMKLVPPVRPIVIEDLMRHTSGITYADTGGDLIRQAYGKRDIFIDNPDNATVADRIARLPLSCQPGSTWRYGYSTDILGRVIEVISGQTLYQFMRERLFVPLGMKDTKFVLETPGEWARMAEPMPHDAVMGKSEKARRARTRWESGGGGLVSTVKDYARFGQMILNGGELEGRRYLSREAFTLMTTDKVGPGSGVEHDDNYYPGDGFGFGLGFGVRTGIGVLKPPRAGSIGELKWDSGSGIYLGIDPKEDTVYILMEQTGIERGRIVPTVKKLFYEAFED